MYLSHQRWEELLNAQKYGYDCKIKSGYLFDKYDIFSDFIKELYKIKEAHSKEDPWYSISKLLMNSLYGRFGMDPLFENHSIINLDELDEYFDKYEIKDIKELNAFSTTGEGNKLLISYLFKDYQNTSDTNNSQDNSDKKTSNLVNLERSINKNVSISIASAITAYARIFMSQFKNNPNYKIYYTDTDSLYTDKPLDPSLIGNKLGQFKLENVFDQAVFLAPKVYGGITEKGEEITKIKGYKNKISFNDLKSLLIRKDGSNNIIHLKQQK